MYSDEFLEALGGWQRGWRELPEEKAVRTAALLAVAHEVPPAMRIVTGPCYRKRFLNKTDLPSLVLNGELDEGVSSWTHDIKFAQNFHGFWRDGSFATVFRREPTEDEIILSTEALWADSEFVEAAKSFQSRGGRESSALFHFRDAQREVILRTKMMVHDVIAFTGKSSSFEEMCAQAGVTDPAKMDQAFQALADMGEFPEQPGWIDAAAAQRVLINTREAFLEIVARLQAAI